MSRILHVIDQPGETGPTLTLRLTADFARQAEQADGSQHAWLLLGGQTLRDAARSAGIEDAQVTVLPGPRPLRIPGAMRRVKQVLMQADHVHCWSPSAASLVSGLGRLDAVSRFGQATLCSVSREIISDAYQAMFADQAAAQNLRHRARQRWGVPDQSPVFALLADRPERVNLSSLMLAMMFTHESLDAIDSPRRDVRLVVHPQTLGRMSAEQLAELLHFDEMVIQDAGLLTPWDSLAGCDMAIAPSPLDAGLSIAWADAMGRPIIASPEPRMPELAELPRVTFADGSQTKDLAKAMYDWACALPEPALAASAMA